MYAFPLLLKSRLMIRPEYGNPKYEPDYAGLLMSFIESSDVGDEIAFSALGEDQDTGYTFSLCGAVYGKRGCNSGKQIATSSVIRIVVVDKNDKTALYRAETLNSTYYFYSEELYQSLKDIVVA